MAYQPQTKTWLAFCNFIPLSYTADVYFFSGSNDISAKFEELINRIQKLGYAKFKNPFIIGGLALYEKLREQCDLNFNEFRKILESTTITNYPKTVP